MSGGGTSAGRLSLFAVILLLVTVQALAGCPEKFRYDGEQCALSIPEDIAILYGLELYSEGKLSAVERVARAVVKSGGGTKRFAIALQMAVDFQQGDYEGVVSRAGNLAQKDFEAGGLKGAAWLTDEQVVFLSFLYKINYGFALSLMSEHGKAADVLLELNFPELENLRDAAVYREVVARSCMRSGRYLCARENYHLLLRIYASRDEVGKEVGVVYYNLACNEALRGNYAEVSGFLVKTGFDRDRLMNLIANDGDFSGYKNSPYFSQYLKDAEKEPN